MVQSVELLLDDETDAEVRRQWDRLAAAGLPSQSAHGGTSNRPHVTLAVRRRIDGRADPLLREAARALPLPVRLGALACFGRRQFVLVRLLVPDGSMLGLHAAVAAVLGPDPDGFRNLAPGRWTPHVTLGRRLGGRDVARALELVGGAPERAGAAVACRRWDGDVRREWLLEAPPAAP